MELLFPADLVRGWHGGCTLFRVFIPSVESYRNGAGPRSNDLASRPEADSTVVRQEGSGGYRFEVPDLFSLFRQGTDNQPIEVTRPCIPDS